MKKFMREFRVFIHRGNVIDLAVGIIIGSAFTAISNTLVTNIFMPLISFLTGGISFKNWRIPLGDTDNLLEVGLFIDAVLNFLFTALILFLIIQAINRLRTKLAETTGAEAETPKEKTCPFCKSKIDIGAVRCPHCTSVLEEPPALSE